MLALCLRMRDSHNICAVTNDIFTREDGEFLVKHKALSEDRIMAVETGGCPHAAIREDITANLLACEELTEKHSCDIILLESGGDNLAADFSRELADFTIYVIDTAGGDKVPRKGGQLSPKPFVSHKFISWHLLYAFLVPFFFLSVLLIFLFVGYLFCCESISYLADIFLLKTDCTARIYYVDLPFV